MDSASRPLGRFVNALDAFFCEFDRRDEGCHLLVSVGDYFDSFCRFNLIVEGTPIFLNNSNHLRDNTSMGYTQGQ